MRRIGAMFVFCTLLAGPLVPGVSPAAANEAPRARTGDIAPASASLSEGRGFEGYGDFLASPRTAAAVSQSGGRPPASGGLPEIPVPGQWLLTVLTLALLATGMVALKRLTAATR